MNSTNFSELYSRIQEWSADDEDILLRKLKQFTDNYSKKCEEITNNVENITKNINLIEIEYTNASNKLKNISIKRFMEHIVEDSAQSSEEIKPQRPKENLVILSKEERERNILNKFKSSITKSLENLNIKNLIDIKENNDNNSILDDDNISVSSSKYFQSLQKQKNLNIKLPYIIGTIDYFKNEYLGVATSQSIIGNMLGNSSLSNLGSNANNSNLNLGENNNSNFNQQQHNYFMTNSNNNNLKFNANVNNNNYSNLDKLSMNMNLIEQIYEMKNSYNPAAAEDNLNELLFKNRKKDLNFKNYNNKNNNNNDFFDNANKLMNEQFKNIYSSSNNNKKTQTGIQDPNFVDFTRMNYSNFNNNNNNNLALANNNNNNYNNQNSIEDQIFKADKENILGLQITGELIMPTKKEENFFGVENKNAQNPNNNNNLLIPNRRVTLDNFVKRANLFDVNLIDNEEDEDNTGLFNKKKEAKFNLLIKNTKNNLFANQENIIHSNEESNKAEKELNQKEFELSDAQQQEKMQNNILKESTDQRLGNILRELDSENIKNDIIIDEKENKNKDFLSKHLISNEINEKAKAEKVRNKPATNNLFSDNILEQEEKLFAINKKKNENSNLTKKDKENKGQAENKSSLLKAKNTLKMLFNDDDEEEQIGNMQKNILVAAEKIDKKSTNLTEKLNNLLETESENKENKLISSIIKEEKKKDENKSNKKSQKNISLLVFEEEEDNTLKFNKKLLINDKNNENKEKTNSNENLEKINSSNKNELTQVFEDIFAKNYKPEINQNILPNEGANALDKVKASSLLVENEKAKSNLFDFSAVEANEKEDINKIENKNLKDNLSKDLFDIFTNSAEKDNQESKLKLKSKKNLDFLINLEDQEEGKINDKNISPKVLINKLKADIEIKQQETTFFENKIATKDEKDKFESKENYFETDEKDNLIFDKITNQIIEDDLIITSTEKLIPETNNYKKYFCENHTTTENNQDDNIIAEELNEEEKYKINRRTTNTMIDGEILPGLDNNNTSTIKSKINFDDFENENSTDKTNKELSSKAEKTETVKKQAINFADPLKPLKIKSTKESAKKNIVEKPKAADPIKPRNLIKTVFEDSDEEKVILNSEAKEPLNSEVANQEETTLKKPEIEGLSSPKNHETEIANENKDSLPIKSEISAEERRKSIKVNKFSEIQKLLDMKLQKPILPEVNDINFFIPMRPQNNLENKIVEQKEVQENKKIDNVSMDISVVKKKKKPMLKKFSLLENQSNQDINIAKNEKSQLEQSNNHKEKQTAALNKEENFKALLNKKIKVNKIEQLEESEIGLNYSENKKIINSDSINKTIVSADHSNNKNNELIKESLTENVDKLIDSSTNPVEEPKSIEITEKNNAANNNFEPEEKELKHQEESYDLKFNNIHESENKELKDNSIKELQEQALKDEENKETIKIPEIINEPQKLNQTEKDPDLDQNANSIKKVNKIEFNDDDQEEDGKEKILERKSKDFLAKKKDSEKIKILKNKAKNATNTTIRPRLSTNTGAKKTLNFDEEDE